MPVLFAQVDAFTATPFRGNPAAVCRLDRPRDPAWMQAVAQEMNLSETAFLAPRDDGFSLRWFTPRVEVKLCGHATLASAHVLWEEGEVAAEASARFHTASGLLTARREGDWIELDFPAKPEREAAAPDGLAEVLGARPLYVGASDFDLLVELASESVVRGLEPNVRALAALPARGVIVTARADGTDFDFVSRFFAPAVGVDEDPVTGSAHCVLAPFWAERLRRPQLLGYQASARGGVVRVRLSGDRVLLGGQAVTVAKGKLLV
jgi:PhzF family phenazine biosynthesis protein